MIPVQLEIKGLYSYKESRTIDFRQLTGSGLFGIFGAVGSGKSSILEAIMLALYGNIERLNTLERKSMINLQSKELYISFEFQAGKNNVQNYKAVYSLKRKNKNFEELESASKSTYEWIDQKWMPIETPIESIIGMKMEHFRQTVIIPQGKFRDFIEQKPKDRADMMKELFGLERFDLSYPTAKLLKAVNEQKIQVNTKIEGLAVYNEQRLEEETARHRDLSTEKQKKETSLKSLEVTLNQMGGIRAQYLQLQNLTGQLRELNRATPEIETKKSALKDFKKAKAHIQPILEQIGEMQKEEEKYKVSYKECERWKGDYETRITQLQQAQKKLTEDFQKRGEREAKIRDLKVVMEINRLQTQLEKQKQAVNDRKPMVEKLRARQQELEQTLEQLEIQEENLKLPDTDELADLKSRYNEWTTLEKQIAEKITETDQVKSRISDITSRNSQLLEQLPEGISDFDTWLSQQKTALEDFQNNREKLLQQQGLAGFTAHLHDGQKCPLCGSLEHPEPLAAHFDANAMEENSQWIAKTKALLEGSQEKKSLHEKLLIQISELQKNRLQQEEGLHKIQKKLEDIQSFMSDKGIKNRSDLQEKLVDSENNLSKQKEIRNNIKSCREHNKTLHVQINKEEDALKTAEKQLLEINSSINTKTESIHFREILEKYSGETDAKIEEDSQKVQKALDDLELNLQRTRDKLSEEKNKQATNLANLEQYENQWQKTCDKLISLERELHSRLKENGFEDENQVQDILQSLNNPEKLEEEIQDFERKKYHTEEGLKELEKIPQVVTFEEKKYQELTEELATAKQLLEQISQEIALNNKAIEDIHHSLSQKKLLDAQLQKLEKRQAYLKEMDGLFKGSGFVKYVSNIYLKELCQTANQRFMKLNKNSLSLEVDEQNTFWVKDYLNSGRLRLLKSLSGGQTFQASLCLALALAEKVKSLNRAEQSFFFLDEGFGALDKPSLRTVFDTLKTLRNEKRVVGIISHVEELQQEIEVYAKIELDPEEGSRISYSF